MKNKKESALSLTQQEITELLKTTPSGIKKYIDELNVAELKDLTKLLFIEDEVIYKWYFEKNPDKLIPKTKVTIMLKNFKL